VGEGGFKVVSGLKVVRLHFRNKMKLSGEIKPSKKPTPCNTFGGGTIMPLITYVLGIKKEEGA